MTKIFYRQNELSNYFPPLRYLKEFFQWRRTEKNQVAQLTKILLPNVKMFNRFRKSQYSAQKERKVQ